MNAKWKRLLSGFLTVAMMFSLVPVSFATDSENNSGIPIVYNVTKGNGSAESAKITNQNLRGDGGITVTVDGTTYTMGSIVGYFPESGTYTVKLPNQTSYTEYSNGVPIYTWTLTSIQYGFVEKPNAGISGNATTLNKEDNGAFSNLTISKGKGSYLKINYVFTATQAETSNVSYKFNLPDSAVLMKVSDGFSKTQTNKTECTVSMVQGLSIGLIPNDPEFSNVDDFIAYKGSNIDGEETRTWYEFLGWKVQNAEDKTGEQAQSEGDFAPEETLIVATDDMTLLGQWKEIPASDLEVARTDPNAPALGLTKKYTVDGEQYDAQISQHKSDSTDWTQNGKGVPLALNEDRQVFYKATMQMDYGIANLLALGSGNGNDSNGITDKSFAGFTIHVKLDNKLEPVSNSEGKVTFQFTCTFLEPTGKILDGNGKEIANVTIAKEQDGKTTTFTVDAAAVPSEFAIPVQWKSGSYTVQELQEEISLEVAQTQVKGTGHQIVKTSGYIDGYIDLTKAGQTENSILYAVLSQPEWRSYYYKDGKIDIVDAIKAEEHLKYAIKNLHLNANEVFAYVGTPEWQTSKSKTATNLDSNYESKVTLSLPAAEEKLVSDVVFVLDKSTSASLEDQALKMLSDLKTQVEQTNAKVNVGVVIFNNEANVANDGKFFDLATQYEEIETAIKQKISSGTNTHAGLLAGKAMLDNDTSVDANRKYLIFVSDGISYMYDSDAKIVPYYWLNDGRPYYSADPYSWKFKYGDDDAPASWDTWLSNVSEILKSENITPILYSNKDNLATTGTNVSSKKETEYTTSVDRALYYTYNTYQAAENAGYHCYAVVAETGKETNYAWGPSFIEYLGGENATTFDDIQNDIYYLLDAGSKVEDYMGYVEGDYNFDFVDNASQLTLTVGSETLKATQLINGKGETSKYGFGNAKDGVYPYVLTYYAGEKTSDEHFVWKINVPVSNFAPVQLTYTVKLINPKTASGTYGQYDADGSKGYSGLYTNISAVLNPVDSNGISGAPEAFAKPTVSYTVSSGGHGGSGSGGNKPSLNTEDHYGYIIGYPDGPVRPEGTITRGEVATIFFRMLTDESRSEFWSQTNGYSDVAASAWYNNAISTLSKAGIIAGYEDGTFRPEGSITRAEFATIAVRFFEATYNGQDLFPDIDGHWAQDYINQAANNGLVTGYPDGTFGPDRLITRAEAFTLVNRTLDRHPDQNYFLEGMLTWPDNMDTTQWYYADVQEATNSHEYEMKTDAKGNQYEVWTKILPMRDWEAFEKTWSDSNSADNPGDVV